MAFVHDAKRCVIASDWHVPFHHKLNVNALFEFCRDFKPHAAVIAGDFLDLPEVSQHNAGSVAKLENLRIVDTFNAGNEVLDRFDRALGKSCTERVFLSGNHEDRLYRWLQRGDNAVFIGDPLVDIGKRLNLEKRKFKFLNDYPHDVYKLGSLNIVHGFYFGLHAAHQHVMKYGANVMFGHTHRAGLFFMPTMDAQRGGYALGHMASEQSKHLRYGAPIKGWSEGFGTALVRKSGHFQAELHNFVDGVFYYGGQQYGELR